MKNERLGSITNHESPTASIEDCEILEQWFEILRKELTASSQLTTFALSLTQYLQEPSHNTVISVEN